jgi:hypothetical protein
MDPDTTGPERGGALPVLPARCRPAAAARVFPATAPRVPFQALQPLLQMAVMGAARLRAGKACRYPRAPFSASPPAPAPTAPAPPRARRCPSHPPGLGVVWFNIGRQQLHICQGPDAQRLPDGGAIGLTMPGVEALAARLERVQSLLGWAGGAGMQLSCRALPRAACCLLRMPPRSAACLSRTAPRPLPRAVCPRLLRAPRASGVAPRGHRHARPANNARPRPRGRPKPPTSLPPKNRARPRGREVAVSHIAPGALEVRDPWGNPYIVSEPPADAVPQERLRISQLLLPCHPGTARGIASFYEAVLGARSEAGEGWAEVVVGPGARLVFKESRALGPAGDEVGRRRGFWVVGVGGLAPLSAFLGGPRGATPARSPAPRHTPDPAAAGPSPRPRTQRASHIRTTLKPRNHTALGPPPPGRGLPLLRLPRRHLHFGVQRCLLPGGGSWAGLQRPPLPGQVLQLRGRGPQQAVPVQGGRLLGRVGVGVGVGVGVELVPCLWSETWKPLQRA